MNKSFLNFSYQKYFQRFYHSPVFNTWISFGAKTLSPILVIPLILRLFSVEEITVWYLFATIIGLQSLFDVGFSPTFSRAISYALGGRKDFSENTVFTQTKNIEPNIEMLSNVVSVMRKIYVILSVIGSFFLLTLGTWSVQKPISLLSNPFDGWSAWGVILVTSIIGIWNTNYVSFLQGMNKIALLRRWEAIFSLCSIITSFIVLLLNGGIVALALFNQGWVLINMLWNKQLVTKVCSEYNIVRRLSQYHWSLFKDIWQSSWRSGIGVLMSYGVVQASGIIYAQIGSSTHAASYLLSLRFLNMINAVSQAPFYTKIPLLSRLWSEGKVEEEIVVAKRGMIISYWTFVILIVAVGLSIEYILTVIQSNTTFVSPILWGLMGTAAVVERYGGMHIQLYSTTNRIIWHIANGVSGIIIIVLYYFLLPLLDVFTFPVAMLVANVAFHSWYSAYHSYKVFPMRFWKFESETFFAPLLVLFLFITYTLLMRG